MNNRLLLGCEYNYPKRFKRMPWSVQSRQRVGVRAYWGTVEGKNNWAKDMPFKVRMFHKIHSMVDHEQIGGESKSWQTAWRRLQARQVMWPDIQTEIY